MSAGGSLTLSCLRRAVAKIERRPAELEKSRRIPLGMAAVDQALGGGLACGTLHDVSPRGPFDFGVASGFALALAARRGGETLWIQQDFAGAEAGLVYGPGLDLFVLPSQRLLVLHVARAVDVLWAAEEALRCRALAGVVAEVAHDAAVDLTTTRRLALAAQEGRGIGILLLQRSSRVPSAAATRWQIAALPSQPDEFGGLGRPGFDLSLFKNRNGPGGRWSVTWNQHDCIFSPLSLGVAVPADDRQDRALHAATG